MELTELKLDVYYKYEGDDHNRVTDMSYSQEELFELIKKHFQEEVFGDSIVTDIVIAEIKSN